MKKVLLALSAIMFAFMACTEDPAAPDNQEGGNEEQPSGKGEFALVSAATQSIGFAGGEVKVEFTSTVDWSASLDVETSVASLAPKSGSAEDTFVKVNVTAFEEKNASRTIKLTLKPDGLASQVVTITQEGEFEPFFRLSTDKLKGGVGQNTVSFTFETNTEYEVHTYEEFEEWAPFTIQENIGTFTLAANPEFAERTAYVKFTVPAIQVPVLDEDGNETEETEDAAFRVYVTQEGHAALEWLVQIPEAVAAEATNYSYALYAGIPLLCNGSDLFMINPANGEINPEPMDMGGSKFVSVANDDANNLLFQIGGAYTETVTVFVMPADGSQSFVLLNWSNPYYGYGLKKLTAKGDVTKQAVVTMFNGGAPSYSGVNACLYWNIGDGMAAWEQTTPGDDNTWVTKPTGNIPPAHLATYNCWDSYRCFFAPVGPNVSDGFVFNGYESRYKFEYYNGSAWADILDTPYTWESGVNSFRSINWDGEDYSVAVGMSYFPVWAMPSDVWFMKGNGATLEPITTLKYKALTTEGLDADLSIHAYKPGATDVVLTMDGNKLVAYIVDGALKVAAKYTFSK